MSKDLNTSFKFLRVRERLSQGGHGDSPAADSSEAPAGARGVAADQADDTGDVDYSDLHREQAAACDARAERIVSVLNCSMDLARGTLQRFGLSLEDALAHLLETGWEAADGERQGGPETGDTSVLANMGGRSTDQSTAATSGPTGDADLEAAIQASLADVHPSAQFGGRDFTSGETLLGSSEDNVLLVSSIVRGNVFLPFPKGHDPFHNPDHIPQTLFKDEHGFLPLSPLQTKECHEWRRLSDIITSPRLFLSGVSSNAITQNVVSDCSFLSSSAAAAALEVNHDRKLLSATIYPNEVSPVGKYICRFFINGIYRQVVIDDYVPVDQDGAVLCSVSSNRNEMWLTLLEKAYMKVMGGYHLMEGSDSCSDMCLLFGWIPERVKIDRQLDADTEWDRIHTAQVAGRALVTLTTGQVRNAVFDEVSGMEVSTTNGLVANHCYAVLETRNTQDGRRLLKVKNPWANQKWTGDYSDEDTRNWTDELMQTLDYDSRSNAQFDNGIFWISWPDVVANFATINLAWDPSMYSHQEMVHGRWYADSIGGSTNEFFTYANNPQYVLEISTEIETEVSLYLCRHIKNEDDTAGAGPYIALHVFEPPPPTLRVYSPYRPVLKGVYINSCHFASRLKVPPGHHRYVIIPSMSIKEGGRFSIFVHSQCPVTLSENIPIPETFVRQVASSWTEGSAGGSHSLCSFWKNPMYCLEVKDQNDGQPSDVVIKLATFSRFLVNVHIAHGDKRVSSLTKQLLVASGETYRGHINAVEVSLKPGKYTVIASTFYAGQKGDFSLTVASSHSEVTLTHLPSVEGMALKTINGKFCGPHLCGGRVKYSTYFENPTFLLTPIKPGRVYIRVHIRKGSGPSGSRHPQRHLTQHASLPGTSSAGVEAGGAGLPRPSAPPLVSAVSSSPQVMPVRDSPFSTPPLRRGDSDGVQRDSEGSSASGSHSGSFDRRAVQSLPVRAAEHPLSRSYREPSIAPSSSSSVYAASSTGSETTLLTPHTPISPAVGEEMTPTLSAALGPSPTSGEGCQNIEESIVSPPRPHHVRGHTVHTLHSSSAPLPSELATASPAPTAPTAHGRSSAAAAAAAASHHRAFSSGAQPALPHLNLRVWKCQPGQPVTLKKDKPYLHSGKYSSSPTGVFVGPIMCDNPQESLIAVLSTYEANQCCDFVMQIYSDEGVEVQENYQIPQGTRAVATDSL
eukprot:TRINITY_DN1168_c0_g1_i2.p1 TRINITY_DN1168_c0_g1~~TRINITY_DN1168_c0_g1_i2.p1  ORF type:complete len:1191 (-),score=145.97 TRINITY_DN1168_c0_g1_i2:53-3625(-)